MKIKGLLLLLTLISIFIKGYAQAPQLEADYPLSFVNYQLHRVPPRKEIRHKLKPNQQEPTYTLTEATRAQGEYIMQEFPTQGEIHGVVLLVAFQDVEFCMSDDSIRALLQARYDGDNYSEYIEHQEYSEVDNRVIGVRATIPGSARDYFREMSMGQFTPHFDVVGPITLDNPRSHYGKNNAAGRDKNARAMITEACRKAHDRQLVDFANYDANDDGVVDFIYVVYAGSDEAQTGIEDCVWAHSSNVSLQLGHMRTGHYACSGELFVDLPNLPAGIGTFVHEFSHILGLPDFYNTQADDFTMDVWSVMDYGMYNRGGFVPCAYTAFERYSLGWLPMQTLDAPATMSISTTNEERTGYRIFTSDIDSTSIISETDTASFYLIENIRKEGWNSYAYAEGLLISEVTYKASAWRNNTVNTSTHRHCIVPANNRYHYDTPEKALYGTNNHEFSPSSTPASVTKYGASMNKPLTDIRYNAETGKASFHFRGGNSIKNLPITNHQAPIKYDLSGRPMPQSAEGIYIQEGKKLLHSH